MDSYTILDAKIVRGHGYGQYNIQIDCVIDNQKRKLSLHSTDSQLFDKANDPDNDHSAVVMEDAKYIIKRGIDDFASINC